ncbi:MAG TPA: branched-chain amino acid ABC transporter permease [Verrucomicrobiae bacterium]|jgi:branched-chain amino acid transport system permease protein|nr:branched-chain amino acid ABC transporter permease [Verrucomicrobiae bacterium]
MLARSQYVLLAALLAVLVVSLFSSSYNPYFLDIAVTCGINITLAVSLNLINGFTGQFSLGHAGFMAIGAYSSAVLTTNYGAKLLPLVGGMIWILFPLALCVGGLVAAGAGLLVGIPSLRLKGDYLAIVTLGFGEIIRVILQNIDAVGGARGMTGIPDYTNLFWTFGLAAITVYVVWALVNSTYGRGFIAVSDDEVAAESMGINTTRYKIIAFVVGAFFAGAAGGIYAHFKQYIAPVSFDFNKSIEIVVMVILGGMGRNAGVIAAAVLLTLLPEGLRMLAGFSPSLAWIADSRMLLYSLLLIVLMITRPQGLLAWPAWKRKSA